MVHKLATKGCNLTKFIPAVWTDYYFQPFKKKKKKLSLIKLVVTAGLNWLQDMCDVASFPVIVTHTVISHLTRKGGEIPGTLYLLLVVNPLL